MSTKNRKNSAPGSISTSLALKSATEFANQIFWQRSRDGVGVRKVGEEQRGVSCQGCRSDVVALVIEVGKDHLPASFALCRKCAAIIGDDLGKALQGG